ncbi:efflux RND transporter periplasmic adaptor subunit [Sporosarcina sp. ANT_H38]|uniref:efflux RND transporter periplasmic adaptor subunit n=1 Tax=Sporosarcina sp. ANT_H38 TaxID=2597358 RepID=UPI0011F39367|nr:efflux RND transporter periplasmic adaptor subunit [Sporosarcina sp. ANT_H38]KAA0955622.1 efflux RND transporter periplasmic adaptor subunit [Sporosarcina sp. ANT_H38]
MNKVKNIAVTIAISAFLAVNFYLLFSDKSVITKSVYVERYERMTNGDHREELAKEGFVAPLETYNVYVGNDDTVDKWLVKEGDLVKVGDEIAILQTDRAEGQRAVWESELKALQQQTASVRSMIANLESERKTAQSDSSSNVKRNDNVSENAADTTVEVGLNVDVQVDVKQDGTFAQAIAAAEQDLAEIEREQTVVEAQLSQTPGRPALISPVDGVVSKVTRTGSTLAVDIFSSQKVFVTYAKNDEWKKIKNGDRVLIQGNGIGNAVEGTVLSVSQSPAVENEWLQAYKVLDDAEAKNPLSYYEVRILADAANQSVPFGANVNAIVILNEALDAISVKEKWLHDLYNETAFAWMIDNTGRATKVEIATPFTWSNRAIVTHGLKLGDVVVSEPSLYTYEYAPKAFMSLPLELPSKEQWRAFGWRNYVKYILIR